MATKKFTDFSLRNSQTLSPNDFIVGYTSEATGEIRTTVRSVLNVPYVEVTRTASAGNQQRINDTEYVMDWNVKNFETNSFSLSGDPSNYNIVLKQTGFYEVEARYSGYDLTQADYLLLRLRGSTTPITTFTSNLLELLDVRDPGAFISLNGTASTFGRTIIRVSTVPYFLAVSYQGGGGAADGSIAYYTVAENTFGNLPRIRVRRINNL